MAGRASFLADQLGRGPRRVIVSPVLFNRKTQSDFGWAFIGLIEDDQESACQPGTVCALVLQAPLCPTPRRLISRIPYPATACAVRVAEHVPAPPVGPSLHGTERRHLSIPGGGVRCLLGSDDRGSPFPDSLGEDRVGCTPAEAPSSIVPATTLRPRPRRGPSPSAKAVPVMTRTGSTRTMTASRASVCFAIAGWPRMPGGSWPGASALLEAVQTRPAVIQVVAGQDVLFCPSGVGDRGADKAHRPRVIPGVVRPAVAIEIACK
jgi:hypothetical protein